MEPVVFSWEGEFVAVEGMLSATAELFEWCSICGDWDALDPGREDFTVFFLGPNLQTCGVLQLKFGSNWQQVLA